MVALSLLLQKGWLKITEKSIIMKILKRAGNKTRLSGEHLTRQLSNY